MHKKFIDIILLGLLILFGISGNVSGQCIDCQLAINKKGTCKDILVQLEAKTNGKFIGWRDSSNNLIDTAKIILISPQVQSVYTAYSEFGNINLLENGNFEAGNSGFESDYQFTGSAFKNSSYTVAEDPNEFLNAYVSKKDPINRNGKMLIVDGNKDSTKAAYRSFIPVTKDSVYFVSFQTSNIHEEFANTNPDTSAQKIPIIQVFIDNILQLTFSMPLDTLWHTLKFNWTSIRSSQIKFEIKSRSTSVKGNDFAIDEVNFSSSLSKTASVKIMPCNTEQIISPDGDGQFDTFFIQEPGLAKIIDLDGNIIHELAAPGYWDGTKKNGSLANAGYYAIVVKSQVYRVSLFR